MTWETSTWMDRLGWLAGLAEGFGILVAIVAIIVSLLTFKSQHRSECYAKLDEMYFELQGLAMQDARLCYPDRHRGEAGFSEKYDLYASMVWNFLETIYDRSRGDIHLCETWQPILEHESLAHRDWLCAGKNRTRFKSKFRTFLNAGGFAGDGSPMHGRFTEALSPNDPATP
jgi:hypothetical protein